jgi:hypothetical protein
MEEILIRFFISYTRNTWLYPEPVKVYVRKGLHLGTDRKMHHYLDIANITVDPKFRRQGHFKAFLALCQEIQPYDGIKVENVVNEDLCAYLRRLALSDPRWTETGIDICPDFLWETFQTERADS